MRAALRDLQWRRLRFAIAVIGTALVFAVSLLLSGVSASFGREADRMLHDVAGDVWLVRDGVPGPFTSFVPMRAGWSDQFKGPDITEASPLLIVHHTARRLTESGRPLPGDPFRDVTLFGVVPGAIGSPVVTKGRAIKQGTDAVVDVSLGYALGERLSVGSQILTVVGHTRGATLFAGLPNVYINLSSAQHLFAGAGQDDIANVIVIRGKLQPPAMVLDVAGAVPLQMLTPADVKADVLRPLANARLTIDLVRLLLWAIAACIVGSVVYVTALERSRDFAVFKASGTSNAGILLGLVAQALVLAVASGLLAVVLALIKSRPQVMTFEVGENIAHHKIVLLWPFERRKARRVRGRLE